MQEKLLPSMADADAVTEKCGTLLNAAAMLGIPSSLTEQYPAGLGRTVAQLSAKAQNARIFDKVHFSCFADDHLKDRFSAVRDDGRDTIVIAGIEAHVCVAQTAIEMGAAGFRVIVAADAVASRRGTSRDIALDRMRNSGVETTNTESIILQWFNKSGPVHSQPSRDEAQPENKT